MAVAQANAGDHVVASGMMDGRVLAIVMVKPALPYLDIISEVTDASQLPVAADQTSGEYAMEAVAAQGMLNRDAAIRESLLAIRRAGATCIITYRATEAAEAILQETEF